MKYLFLILLLIIIFKTSKFQNYCDLYNYCNNCFYCGFNNNKCNCNFYNGYCFDGNSNQLIYYRDFLRNYDGCYSNEGDQLDICGESFISIKSGESSSRNIYSTNNYNFFCYYSISKYNSDLANKLRVRIQRKENLYSAFNVFFIIYDNNFKIKNETLSNIYVTDNYMEIIEDNCQIISMYLEFDNPLDILELSLSFFSENSEEIETTVPETITQIKILSSSSSSSLGIFIGIAIGGIFFITIIVIIVIKIKKNKKSEGKKLELMLENKFKVDNLLKKYKKNLYDKNLIKNCTKCIICDKDFIEYSDIVITTNCVHTFHETCFKNGIYSNIINPKCPKCYTSILDSKSENNVVKQIMPDDQTTHNMTIERILDK